MLSFELLCRDRVVDISGVCLSRKSCFSLKLLPDLARARRLPPPPFRVSAYEVCKKFPQLSRLHVNSARSLPRVLLFFFAEVATPLAKHSAIFGGGDVTTRLGETASAYSPSPSLPPLPICRLKQLIGFSSYAA